MFTELKKRWFSISARERLIVLLGAATIAIIAGYQLVYRPFLTATQTMQTNVSSLRSNLVWLREQAAHGTVAESQSNDSTRQATDQSFVAILERTARANDLAGSIAQITPSANQMTVQVVLENASFNGWVSWIAVLEQQFGVRVESATVERQSAPDTAQIRMEFARE